jgi:hypothetical protein
MSQAMTVLGLFALLNRILLSTLRIYKRTVPVRIRLLIGQVGMSRAIRWYDHSSGTEFYSGGTRPPNQRHRTHHGAPQGGVVVCGPRRQIRYVCNHFRLRNIAAVGVDRHALDQPVHQVRRLRADRFVVERLAQRAHLLREPAHEIGVRQDLRDGHHRRRSCKAHLDVCLLRLALHEHLGQGRSDDAAQQVGRQVAKLGIEHGQMVPERLMAIDLVAGDLRDLSVERLGEELGVLLGEGVILQDRESAAVSSAPLRTDSPLPQVPRSLWPAQR